MRWEGVSCRDLPCRGKDILLIWIYGVIGECGKEGEDGEGSKERREERRGQGGREVCEDGLEIE